MSDIYLSLEQDVLKRIVQYEAEQVEAVLSEALRIRGMTDEEFSVYVESVKAQMDSILSFSLEDDND